MPRIASLIVMGTVFCATALLRADHPMLLKDNFTVLRCALPDLKTRFAGSNAPQQIFYDDEQVDVKLIFAKSAQASGNWAIEIQAITTRDPDKKIDDMEGFSDTGGHAPLLGIEGKPALHPITPVFDGNPQTIANLPVPNRFGTYALLLVNGDSRKFLATVARVPKPHEGGTLENTPIFGEFGMFDKPELFDQRAAAYERMGIHGCASNRDGRNARTVRRIGLERINSLTPQAAIASSSWLPSAAARGGCGRSTRIRLRRRLTLTGISVPIGATPIGSAIQSFIRDGENGSPNMCAATGRTERAPYGVLKITTSRGKEAESAGGATCSNTARCKK